MSALATVAAKVVATVTPTPTPTATPVAHVVAAVSHPGLLDSVNTYVTHIPQSEVIAVAAVIAVALQSQLNKLSLLQHDLAYIQDVRRHVVAVGLPLLGTLTASFASGINTLGLTPVLYLAGQIAFYVVRYIRGTAAATSTAPVTGTDTGVA